jgi:glycosyltransferase involved in cell wall biosynthesis
VGALDAAKRAGVSLLLAGKVYAYADHERYFKMEILPRLDQRRRFIGAVGLTHKRRLLSAATCLLAPSLAPETSSLVAMEALACGTATIRCGADGGRVSRNVSFAG